MTGARKRPIIGEAEMRIPDEFIRCVTYLYVDRVGHGVTTRIPGATAFFVGFPEDGLVFPYLVTAGHCVEGLRRYSRSWVRINTKGGGYRDVEAPIGAWIQSPESDVAIASVASQDHDDFLMVPAQLIATDDYVWNVMKLGAGDDVFFVGLFSQRPGRERPEPITRFGNISLIPKTDVKIKLPTGEKWIQAYLVEARSLGGHSGSPVFVFYGADRIYGMTTVGGGPPPRLLGLIHGHYDLEGDQPLLCDITDSTRRDRNAAVVVVVPGQRILELLMEDEVVKERKGRAKKIREGESTPRADFGSEISGITREEFEQALKKVSRRVESSPSQEEKRT